MGFWGNLGKIGSIVGAGAATAMSGGGAAPLLGMALSTAGSLGKGMSAGREKENAAASAATDFQLKERQMAEQAGQNRAGIDLNQKQFQQGDANDAYKNAIRSALLMNMKDGSFNRPANIPNISFSGGLRPSAIGPEGLAAAKLQNEKSMQRMQNPTEFAAMAPIERTASAEYKKPGFWENALGTAGTVGNAISGAKTAADDSMFQKGIMAKLAALSAGKSAAPAPTDPYDPEL